MNNCYDKIAKKNGLKEVGPNEYIHERSGKRYFLTSLGYYSIDQLEAIKIKQQYENAELDSTDIIVLIIILLVLISIGLVLGGLFL